MKPTKIRWMKDEDLHYIMDIENRSFRFPWTPREFLYHRRNPDSMGLVVEIDRDIIGYMVYRTSNLYNQILNLAVDRIYRRTGVATLLVTHLIHVMEHQRRIGIAALVRETNLDAQLFFRSLDFKATKVLKVPYENNDEDGYLFEYCPPWPEIIDSEQINQVG